MSTIMPSRSFRAACSICLFAAAATLAPSAKAQDQYRRIPVDRKMAKRIRATTINTMLRSGLTPANEKTVTEYYQKCVFPEWTNPDNFAVKGKDSKTPRQRILGDLKRAKAGAAGHDRLRALVKEQMLEFAKGNYHPATRYNATLLIGELNEEKPGFDDPKPLAETLPWLLSAATDDNLPDAVRFPALLGLVRHAQYGAKDDADRQKINAVMLSLIKMSSPPEGRSKAGHAWFRRLAMNTLSRTGSADVRKPLAKALAEVIGESDAPLSVRCEAAEALGWLPLTAEAGIDPTVVGDSLQNLFLEVAKKEIEAGKDDKEYIINTRQLKARLTAILAALAGSNNRDNRSGKGIIPLAANPETKKQLETLQNDIERLLNRDHLDHSDLVVKTEKPKKKKDDPHGGFGPRGHGPGDLLGAEGPPGPAGPMGPGGLLGGPDMAKKEDPAKPVSDKIMEELKRLVEKYEGDQESS